MSQFVKLDETLIPKMKSCFVIAPIGDQDSETRKRSDQVLKHIIKPAALACGYSAIRADEIDSPCMITSQVIQRVVNDDLVIADLTDTNPNVFYELAIRHAIRRPLVQIIKKGEKIPFDVAGSRVIHFNHHDLDSADEAKRMISEQIKATETAEYDYDTPISVALDLQSLRQSEDPEDRSLAEILDGMSDLRTQILRFEASVMESQDRANSERSELAREIAHRVSHHIGRTLGDPQRVGGRNRTIASLVRELSGAGSMPEIIVILSQSPTRLNWIRDFCMLAYKFSLEDNRTALVD
jgi:K+/H+ antiporter YhaU regulatory subunit KhtT